MNLTDKEQALRYKHMSGNRLRTYENIMLF